MEGRRRSGCFDGGDLGEATDPSLSPRQRGMLVRVVGRSVSTWARMGGGWGASRNTMDRWIRAYRRGGFGALVRRRGGLLSEAQIRHGRQFIVGIGGRGTKEEVTPGRVSGEGGRGRQ